MSLILLNHVAPALASEVELAHVAGLENSQVIPVSDKHIYWTEWNWDFQDYTSSSPQQVSNCVGAYFKTVISNSNQFGLAINLDGTDSDPFMTILYKLNGETFEFTLPNDVSSDGLYFHPRSISETPHTLQLWIKNSDYNTADRWLQMSAFLAVQGIILSSSGGLDYPDLRPQRILLYADSIGEGVITDSHELAPLVDNNVLHAFPQTLAMNMNAEISIVAYSGLGWNTPGDTTVPRFAQAGNPDRQVWDHYSRDRLRINSEGRFINGSPDYIFVVLGTNDIDPQYHDPERIADHVTYFLNQARSAAPASVIFIVIAFGQFCKDSVTDGYNAYQQSNFDNKAHIIDLGEELAARYGLDGEHGGFYDLHPRAEYSLELGEILARHAKAKL